MSSLSSDGKETSEEEGKLSSSNWEVRITLLSPDGLARMRQTENAGQCPIDAADGEKTQDYSAYVLCSCYSGISRPRPLTLLLSTPTALGPVATRPFGPLRSSGEACYPLRRG